MQCHAETLLKPHIHVVTNRRAHRNCHCTFKTAVKPQLPAACFLHEIGLRASCSSSAWSAPCVKRNAPCSCVIVSLSAASSCCSCCRAAPPPSCSQPPPPLPPFKRAPGPPPPGDGLPIYERMLSNARTAAAPHGMLSSGRRWQQQQLHEQSQKKARRAARTHRASPPSYRPA